MLDIATGLQLPRLVTNAEMYYGQLPCMALVSQLCSSTMQAWLAGNVQEYPVLHHLHRRFCTDAAGSALGLPASEQLAPATSQPAEHASSPAAAAAAALPQSHDDSAHHQTKDSDEAVTQQIAPEGSAAQASLPPVLRYIVLVCNCASQFLIVFQVMPA